VTIVAFCVWATAILVSVPFLILAAEALAGLKRRHASSNLPPIPGEGIVVLIPAHNEEGGIVTSLEAIRATAPPGVKLLVVADNCTDKTAQCARDSGAEVIERTEPGRRGKIYALAFGRDWLAKSPPQCVVFIDADCRPDKGAIALLSATCIAQHAPVQGCNLLVSDLQADPRVQMSNFAFWFKNLIRTRGMMRISGASLLMGTGMAMPWSLFASAPLDTNDLAEDAALGIALMKVGHTPVFCEEARVTSAPAQLADTLVQRTRWEHGFISTARKHALPLIGSGLVQARVDLVWTGLHLLVPALALLAVVGVTALAGAAIYAFSIGTNGPALLLAGSMSIALGLVALAWLKEGRSVIGLSAALSLPLYIVWKLPVYLKLVGKRQTDWIRTKRPGE
jgi:cellulose synthase/poly-beta-1,6-N-acetylglucosamine synthase-like glycosyltransferase